MRILKEELIEQFGKPVGSCWAGWYKCISEEDFNACIGEYRAKATDMHRKIAALERTRERLLGQPMLPLGMTTNG